MKLELLVSRHPLSVRCRGGPTGTYSKAKLTFSAQPMGATS